MYTQTFQQLNKSSASQAGGKGASLGEMTRAGIPVPPGFVVLIDSFKAFVQESAISAEIMALLDKVSVDDVNTIEKVSQHIRELIAAAKMPEAVVTAIQQAYSQLGASLVAVRSSATAEDSSAASWAGELESYLNVTEDTLLETVKRCWSSLYTPRAIFYRIEKGMREIEVYVAVVVQKMIQSEVSGICFTVHPVTEDPNQMIIEAGYGLGEAIVGGMITPDSYVLNKADPDNLEISSIYVSQQKMRIVRSADGTKEERVPVVEQEKQKLAERYIKKLAAICLLIEKHYGFPCDIEWALEKDKLYITQSRPITTLKR